MAKNPVSHVSESGGAKGLGMEVRIVEFPVDLASFNLAEGDLLLDIIDNHEKVFAFLGISGVVIRHSDDRAIVLHNDGGEFQGDTELLAEGDDKVEVFGEGEYGAGFGMGRRGCDGSLFDAAVVKCTVSAIEGYGITGMAFTIRVEEVRSVDLTIKAEDAKNGLM